MRPKSKVDMNRIGSTREMAGFDMTAEGRGRERRERKRGEGGEEEEGRREREWRRGGEGQVSVKYYFKGCYYYIVFT